MIRAPSLLPLTLTVALACAGTTVPRADGARLLQLPEDRYRDPRVTVAERTDDDGFRLEVSRTMPTPGWKLKVDEVVVDGEARRIVVRIDERGPSGMVAQVMSDTAVGIDLPRLERGRWWVEIHSRRADDAPWTPQLAFPVVAR